MKIEQQTVNIEEFEIMPDTTLYGKLGRVGYNLKDAISELVDNSIDSRIPGEKLTVEIDFDEINQRIIVKDNGRGMTKEEAKSAIILGKSKKMGELGFFGLGLKTAGLSLGNIISIKTKERESKETHLVEFDREDFEAKANWILGIKSVQDELSSNGTTITINDLIITLTYQKADRLEKYFGERYRSFINSREVEILINGFECIPSIPEYIIEEKINLTTATGNNITGILKIQTKRSQKKQEYGFDLYKNKRIISSFDKIGIGGMHGEKALICGDLNFNFCPVNFKKTSFLTQSREYTAAKSALEQYIKPLIPLFISKNLNKEKIERLLDMQKETGKVLNLEEFKIAVNTIENGNEEEFIQKTKINPKEKSDNIEFESVPEHTILINTLETHSSLLGEVSKKLGEITRDEKSIGKISSDPFAKSILEAYSESLLNVSDQTKELLSKL